MEKENPGYKELEEKLAASEAAAGRMAEQAERNSHIMKVLLAIRNVNKLIITENDPSILIQKACENLILTMGYHHAWIVLFDKNNNIRETASSGFKDDFASMKEYLEKEGKLECIKKVVDTKGIVIIKDPQTYCPGCPLRDEYTNRASFSKKLMYQGHLYGIISVSVPIVYVDYREEKELFAELTSDVSYALHKIYKNKQLHLFEHIVSTTPNLISFITSDYRYETVNDGYCRYFNLSRDKIVGHRVAELSGEDVFVNTIKPKMDRCLKGEALQYEVSIHVPDIGERFLRMDYQPYQSNGSGITGIVVHGIDITEIREAENKLREEGDRAKLYFDVSGVILLAMDENGIITQINQKGCSVLGASQEEILNRDYFKEFIPDSINKQMKTVFSQLMRGDIEPVEYFENPIISHSGEERLIAWHNTVLRDKDGKITGTLSSGEDITEKKRAEVALEKRLIALTRPLSKQNNIEFEELFNLEEIQELQEEFALATGVASMITHTDGTPITRPSQFCHLCNNIIRKTEKGRRNCYRSDAELGKYNPDGPTIQPCMSGGLWDAGAAISVGGHHIANWLIGQVRDNTQSEEKIRQYARDIGADEDEAAAAFQAVPAMSRERFEQISQALFTLANQLSNIAYQNVQQARFITDLDNARKALDDSEKRMELAILGADLGTWDWDIVNESVVFNDQWCDMVGYAREELDDGVEAWENLVHPDDFPFVNEKLEEHIQGKTDQYETEHRMRHKSGNWVWVLDRGKVIERDQDGKALRACGTHLDITERKKAEEALRERDMHFSSLLENPVGYLIYRLQAGPDPMSPIVTLVSPSIEQILGIPLEDSMDFTSWFVNVHPEDFSRLKEANIRGCQPPFLFDEEFRYKHPTRGWIWLHARSNGIPKEDNPEWIEWANGIIVDITDRVLAREALQESEEKYRLLAETADDFIVLHDLKGRILFINQSGLSFLGYSSEEILSHNIMEFVPDSELEGVVDRQVNRHEGFSGKKEYETKLVNKDGEEIPVEVKSTAVIKEGNIDSILIIARDISDRKKAIVRQEQLQAQLVQAQKLESIGRLAGGVAHDFNNMLQTILGNCELVSMDDALSKDNRKLVSEIEHAADQSANLTRQLLAFARRQPISPKAVILNDVVTGTLNMLRRLIGEDIDLAWMPGVDLWPVKIDTTQINQILANLAVNARDAISGNGKLTIETENVVFDEDYCEINMGFVPGDFVKIAISDDGCGIPNEILKDVFEPFFTTKKQGEGTGLGLAMAYGIVKQNNGFIKVYSEIDVGTSFKIYFPRFLGDAAPDERKKGRQNVIEGSETILIVEDEPSILRLGKRILEGLGYTVLTANTPEDAFHLIQTYGDKVHLLITDVVMPQMNGKELANALKVSYPDLKTLFMSGYTANVIAHRGILDEGVNFMQKPFSIAILGDQVRRALDS